MEEKQNQGLDIGVMKSGDYLIHVFIQRGKLFQLPQIDNSQSLQVFNAKVVVESGGKSVYSRTLKDTPLNSDNEVYWGEHFFFEPKNMTQDELMQRTIKLSVVDKGLFKDKILGIFELDLSQIYLSSPKHALFNQWIALNNPETEDFNQIKGYLQVGISVQGPGDNSVQLSEEVGQKGQEMGEVMMPSSITKTQKQIKISFIQAQSFPKYDTIGTIDAYFIVTLGKFTHKTKVVTQKNNICDFNQTVLLPVQWPISYDKIIIQLKDQDQVNDEDVAAFQLSAKEIIKNQSEGVFMWYNIYGAPLSLIDGPEKDKMNQDPSIASKWKGRILMHFQALDVRAPLSKIIDCEPILIDQCKSQQIFEMREFEVMAEIGSGICLPKGDKFRVRIQIGEFSFETKDPKESKKSYNRWSERLGPFKIRAPYRNVAEFDRVYLYLVDDNKEICFWRGKAQDFAQPNPDYKWLSLTNDLAVGKVSKSHNAGMLQIKMSINDSQKNPKIEWKNYPTWSKKPLIRVPAFKLRCYVFQCKDLPAADDNGHSDPYFKVWSFDGNEGISKVVKNNLNPIFYQAVEVQINVATMEEAPPIVIDVMDKDEGILEIEDDFLGRAMIRLNDVSVVDCRDKQGDINQIPTPKWHNLRQGMRKDLPVCGQILCSFVLVEIEDRFKIIKPVDVNLSQIVRTDLYTIDVNIMALRNLESMGILPVRKPFIKINTKSLLPPEMCGISNILTQPKETGSNPNINTVVRFQAEIPVDDLFCPQLSCQVFDFICNGINQPLIGSFSINIGEIKVIQKDQFELFKRRADRIIAFLKDHLERVRPNRRIVIQGERWEENVTEEEKMQEDSPLVNIEKDQKRKKYDLFSALRKKMIDDIEKFGGQDLDESLLQNQRVQLDINRTNLIEGEENQTELEHINLKEIQISEQMVKEEESVEMDRNDIISYFKQIFHQLQYSDFQSDKEVFVDLLIQVRDHQPGSIQSLVQHLQQMKQKSESHVKRQSTDSQMNLKKLDGQFTRLIERLLQLKMKMQKLYITKNSFSDGDKHEDLMNFEFETEMVIIPQYKKDSRLGVFREINQPDLDDYMAIGFDKLCTNQDPPQNGNKHYRRCFKDELENSPDIFGKSIFHSAPILRGQTRNMLKSIFNIFQRKSKIDHGSLKSLTKQVGTFKGFVQIWHQEEERERKEDENQKVSEIEDLIEKILEKKEGERVEVRVVGIENREKQGELKDQMKRMGCKWKSIYRFILQTQFQTILLQELKVQQNCLIQLYLLEGFDFASKDLGSLSDPYLIVRCGRQEKNQRDKYQIDELNPQFYQFMEFTAQLPGISPLEIEAWDFDDLFGDELIGKTVIDIDDRFFSSQWRALDEKPVEFRQLYHPSSTLCQGTIKCWVDILTHKQSQTRRKWDISPEPEQDFQLRVAVIETKNVPMADIEGTSDVFVRGWMSDEEKKETDTHWRCQDGNAHFNHRLLFNFKTSPKQSKENLKFKIQVVDRDIFKQNDVLSQFILDLNLLVADCKLTSKFIHLNKKYFNSCSPDSFSTDPNQSISFDDSDDYFWLCLKTPSQDKPIMLKLDVRVLTKNESECQTVGEGRMEPNHSPYLAVPEGRIQMTINPFKMYTQMLGPEVRAKIQKYFSLLICIALFLFIAPTILSSLIIKYL